MKQAVILAAGEGQRLKPFTINKPKAMLSFAGKPLIQFVLESLADNGIRDIILIVGYKREQIFDYIGDGKQFGVEVKYITQSKQLGTAHALTQAKGFTNDEFLVLQGDKLISRDTLVPIISTPSPALLARQEDNPSRYGVVKVEGGKIINLTEKPLHPASNLINTGIYAFDKSIFSYTESFLDIPDVLNEMIGQGKSISVIETDCVWLDIAYPWDILNLNTAILQKIPAVHNGTIETGVSLKGPVSIGKGTIIRANSYISGPVVIGDGCEIGPDVCIFPATSIANNVVIAPFTEIKNSVIGNDVHIGSGSSVQDSVIDRGCLIGGHFCACSEEADVKVDSEIYTVKIGAMMGESCRIGNNVVAQAGIIIGNYSQVKSLNIVSGKLADKSLVV